LFNIGKLQGDPFVICVAMDVLSLQASLSLSLKLVLSVVSLLLVPQGL